MYGPSTSPNQQAFVDAQNFASRRNVCVSVKHSPITAWHAGSLNSGHSNDNCDLDVEVFVPKILSASDSRIVNHYLDTNIYTIIDFGPPPIDDPTKV